MKTSALLFLALFSASAYATDIATTTCPQLAGTYTCETIFDGEIEIYDLTVQQKQVEGVEHYEIPLSDEPTWVMADGVKRENGMDYTLATCEGGSLLATNYQGGPEGAYLQEDYSYSRKSEKAIEVISTFTLVVDGEREQDTFLSKCKSK